MPNEIKLTNDQRTRVRRLCKALSVDVRSTRETLSHLPITNDEIAVFGLRTTFSALGEQIDLDIDDQENAERLREDIVVLRLEGVL